MEGRRSLVLPNHILVQFEGLDQGEEPEPSLNRAGEGSFRMTVWIYVDTREQVGDKDHPRVFADEAAADAWFAGHSLIWRSWATERKSARRRSQRPSVATSLL
jgi:hypothetical protein